jgi:hypothetical protein
VALLPARYEIVQAPVPSKTHNRPIVKQQARTLPAVPTMQADLRAGKKTEGDVLDDLTLGGNDLAHAEYRHYVLGHVLYL